MPNIDEIKFKKLNDALSAVMNMEPIIATSEATEKLTTEMQVGLARAYSDSGLRKYFEYKLNEALKSVALRSTTPFDIAFGKARILTIKEILVRGKQAFEELERIKAVTKKNLKKNS